MMQLVWWQVCTWSLVLSRRLKQLRMVIESCGTLYNMKIGKQLELRIDDQGIVWKGNQLCVPDNKELKEEVMEEAHQSPFSIHSGVTKMYQDLKEHFWWIGMKPGADLYGHLRVPGNPLDFSFRHK